jgi:trimeric autotransporter adhesin
MPSSLATRTCDSLRARSAPELKIDHPLDPAHKFLLHASVGSSEMKNMYDGTVTTDSQGHATVQLPEWFQVLNTDFRYQLTVIGQFAQAIVAREIENNQSAPARLA